MKKIIIAMIMLCLACTFTACKKNQAVEEAAQGDTKPFQLEDELEIELEEDEEGTLAPD